MKNSLVFTDIDIYTIPLSDSLAIRIYSDTRPFKWKIAGLQKGLIFVYDGRELVGAGSGFGCPVLEYSKETYFSGSSQVHLSQEGNLTIIRKDFLMDRIKRNRFRNFVLESQKIRRILDYIAEFYRCHFRFSRLKELLVGFGIRTRFVRASCRGKIIMTYILSQKRIRVKADFRHIRKEDLKKILLLNEQGSRFFRVYLDSNGSRLIDQKIGHWSILRAKWVSIMDSREKIGFQLTHVENSILRRGQEFIKDFLDWVGLDYEIRPENVTFEYDIKILEG
jgi:hypothetical protein